jgi:hypothetical protein
MELELWQWALIGVAVILLVALIVMKSKKK